MKHPTSYLLALLLILTGCSNEIGIGEEELPTPEAPVPILIVPTRIEGTTKASVENFTDETIQHIGIYGKTPTASLYNEGITPSGLSADKQLLFQNPPLVYPTNDEEVSLYGYYPCRSKDNTTPYTVAGGILSFTLTGQEDLLYAAEVKAGKKTSPNSVNLQFVHKLTRVKFQFINNTPTELPLETISIIATGRYRGTMNLLTGSITPAEETTAFTLFTNMIARNLTSDPVAVPGEFLLIPNGSYAFQLNVQNTLYTINLTEEPRWEAGVSYLLTITINSLGQTQAQEEITDQEPTTPEVTPEPEPIPEPAPEQLAPEQEPTPETTPDEPVTKSLSSTQQTAPAIIHGNIIQIED